ncbi:purine nucleoside phosphorylase YfiH [Pantoea sp. 1.19]|uniref:purine nucleoside phosphorylase YfiH n=1 Tax=Pantoea sp. 1.19 TaxID=1925589 RepID=UPI000948F91B|nr:purine nucleoside phosphorylase YfiH [Pantoea sp. 1.19]
MAPLLPAWPAPTNVRAWSTRRDGGVSQGNWHSLNVGGHVGDDPAAVAENRQRLVDALALPGPPVWLEQVHGTDVLTLTHQPPAQRRADAVYTATPGVVCAVMTADCLPVLFCSADGREVAAAHAGWRGLQAGILEATLRRFRAPAGEIHAWLGPAIGPLAFEVGAEVRAAFCAGDPYAAEAFRPRGEKFLADIFQLARRRLSAAGVASVSGGDHCTLTESAHFFSYRRDGVTGRMASLLWLS